MYMLSLPTTALLDTHTHTHTHIQTIHVRFNEPRLLRKRARNLPVSMGPIASVGYAALLALSLPILPASLPGQIFSRASVA